jgi:hypothetical protein
MKVITYRDVARRIALAETDAERLLARDVHAVYGLLCTETITERMSILREELQTALNRERPFRLDEKARDSVRY